MSEYQKDTGDRKHNLRTPVRLRLDGSKLKLFRERRGLTIGRLATLTGLSHATISRAEAGLLKDFAGRSLVEIAGVLGIDADKLYLYEEA